MEEKMEEKWIERIQKAPWKEEDKQAVIDLFTSNECPSLYQSLHHVGDDTTKSDIESSLKEVLDDDIYKLIKAIFAYAVSY